MDKAKLELAEHSEMYPYPFPATKLVSGFYAFGDDELFSSSCGFALNELETNPDYYEGAIVLNSQILPNGEPIEPVECAKTLFKLLNMPGYEQIEEKEIIDQHLEDFKQRHTDEFDTGVHATREQFEEFYERVAASDFVQLSADPDVAYVLKEPVDAEQREELIQLYCWKYRDEAQTVDLATLDIRPILDRKLDLSGFATYDPVHVFMMWEIPYCEPDISDEGPCLWAGWMRNNRFGDD